MFAGPTAMGRKKRQRAGIQVSQGNNHGAGRGLDHYNYIMQATRLRSRLATVKGSIASRQFTDIIIQGLSRNNRDIKLRNTYKYLDLKTQKKNPGYLTALAPGRAHPVSGAAW